MTDRQHETVPDTVSVEHDPTPLTRWLAGVLAVAMLALVGLGGWFVHDHDRAATADAVPGLASPAVTAMLAARVAAVNGGTAADIASFYATDAVLEERDQNPAVVTKTSNNIGEWLYVYQSAGFRLQRTGTATALGPYVTEPLLWSDGGGGMVT